MYVHVTKTRVIAAVIVVLALAIGFGDWGGGDRATAPAAKVTDIQKEDGGDGSDANRLLSNLKFTFDISE